MARPKINPAPRVLAAKETAGSKRPVVNRPVQAEPKEYVHTLSLRLTTEQYRRMRRYVAAEEEKYQSP